MNDDHVELERPAPDPAFRGALGRRLGSGPAPAGRPASLRAWIGGLVTAGVGLLLVALTQI